MRRLVIALTTLLAMAGAAVAVGYLLLFAPATDRASRAAPADTAIYLKVYLQPSSGQKMNLLGLVGHLPGFRDAATLEAKLHEVAQRLLGTAGVNYTADLRPWLGTELAVALTPSHDAGGAAHILLLGVVKDEAIARVAVPRLMARNGVTYTPATYRGHRVMMSAGICYALLTDLLLVADTPDRLRAALDADANVVPSLADSAAFEAAMRTIPADHLASLYVDVPRVGGLDADEHLAGFATAMLALIAEPDGLHLDGSAPFARDTAGAGARAAFALEAQPSSLGAWMPRATLAELDLFGLQQSVADAEKQLAGDPAFAAAVDALNQLRAIAAVGLGINADRDLLPLFDGEAALALSDLDPAAPHAELVMRPSDPVAAQKALDRMRDGLVERGSVLGTQTVGDIRITTVTVPQVGRVAYALSDGVLLVGLDPADVAAGLEAHASGETLATDSRYGPVFERAGTHRGNEVWADIPTLLDAATGIFDPGTELRDILHQIGEFAMSASAVDDRLEIHAVLTVK